eukprot:CAMPEP_0115178840 /NCGR_PEP_ID=MMETSP0270-20121206/6106_1 /TAXON_ID=71861 /ORGANISM="Scrippsiella trochoidea, Strain CCMP3099" /LENGTH=692 /DNA_ID=CAMNT_0002591811 /DNA_START=1 /DNA_END=2075 /DNA_ORIENTATION=-
MRPNRPPPSPWVESNLPHLPPPPAAVLDLACGRGRHALLLLDMGYKVTALDRDREALDVLSKRAPPEGKDRLSVVCADIEANGLPSELRSQQFAVVLVVNYLHRPLLKDLQGLLESGGLLIYESWAKGNEAFAAPRDPCVLAERTLVPDELRELVLPWAEVIGFSDGFLEEYEGHDCVKQLLCARHRSAMVENAVVASGAAALDGQDALRALLVGFDSSADGNGASSAFLGVGAFGKAWLHGRGIAPSLPFGTPELLALLRDYAPHERRDAHLERMRNLAAEGGMLLDDAGSLDEGSVLNDFRLWSASLVKRLPALSGDGLRTETLSDESELRRFFESAALASTADVEARGDGWTIVANQLQGAAPCLGDLQHRLFCRTWLSGGINGYLTPPGAIGKPPHVDDHDVLVLQQDGAKSWLLLDTATREVAAEVVLNAGDVLYLPQGVPHHARAHSDGGQPSLHLAVGLHRSPMSWASILAAVLTLRCHSTSEAQGALPLGVVQEIDSRSSVFAACGGRDHWLRQLPSAHVYLPLIQALDPEDLPSVGMSNERGSDVLACFTKEVASAARNLAELALKGPVRVPGDAPGVAQQRAMLQAAAAGEATELEAVAATSPDELRPLAAQAFWACRERVMDQHFGQSGPWAPPHHESAAAMAIAALAGGGGLSEGAEVVDSPQQQCWQRVPREVAALRRP